MDKQKFLDTLDREINVLPRSERESFISYYDELIEDKKEGGLSEEAAVDEVGSVKEIVKNILAERGEIKIKIPSTGSKVLTISLLVLGFPLWGALLLALLIVVAAAYLVIWLIPVLMGAGAVMLLALGVIFLYYIPVAIMQNPAAAVFMLGCAVLGAGGAGLFGTATALIGKYFVRGSVALTRLIIRPFRKKEVAI